MKRLFLLLFIAVFAVFILLLFFNPQLLDQIWLWMIGLAGSIIGLFRNLYDQLLQLLQRTGVLSKNPTTEEAETTSDEAMDNRTNTLPTSSHPNNCYSTTVSLHRFMNDGETTLGMLFVNQQLICYTLEAGKQASNTHLPFRIPAGTYVFGFHKTETPLTTIYRQQYNWFSSHLVIQDVPGFDTVFLYLGEPENRHQGCVQIADSLNNESLSNSLADSIKAYQRLYEKVTEITNKGEQLHISVYDEATLKNIQLQNV